MSDRARTTTHSAKRAVGYLRWYPRIWRERYGEEFVAHLESELDESPSSLRRSINIAAHGVVTRFHLQRTLRWLTLGTIALVMVVVIAVIYASLQSIPPGLTLTGENSTGSEIQTSTNAVNAATFSFTTAKTERIRVVGIHVITIPGERTPMVATVLRSNVPLDIVNPQGWPPHFLKIDTTSRSPIVLSDAFTSMWTLKASNSVVVGFRTPGDNSVYGVEGISLYYIYRGHHYVTNILNGADALVMCTAPTQGRQVSEWCAAKFASAIALETVRHRPPDTNWSDDQLVAQQVYGEAIAWAQSVNRATDLSDMSYFTAQVSHSLPALGLTRVSMSANGIFHYLFQNPSTGLQSEVCITRPVVNTLTGSLQEFSVGSCAIASRARAAVAQGSSTTPDP